MKKYSIIKPYLIYVGNVYPHKDPEGLVSAFKKLLEKGKKLSLVFVGAEDYFYLRLKKFVSDNGVKNVIFSGFVPDHELDVIFHNAVAYVRPSLYEGFELPPLEAMAKGVPVISSDHDCALEILEDSAYYFKAGDIQKMAEALERVFEDEELRKELIRKGYQQADKYSWRRMGRDTLELYASVTGKK